VTRGFYGGELRDQRYKFVFDDRKIVPDVYDPKKNIAYEAKANRSGHKLDLSETQFRGYQHGQFLDPEMEIFYSIFRHNLPGIGTEERSDEEVISGLLTSTAFSVLVHLSVLDEMVKRKRGSMVHSYSNGLTEWDDCLCVGSPTVNRLFSEPESVLEELDLDLCDYSITRWLSPFKFRVNGTRLTSAFGSEDKPSSAFPVVQIRHNNHDCWVKDFVDGYEVGIEKESLQGDITELPLFALKREEPKEEPLEPVEDIVPF